MRVAIVSTYPPRACGIGTFSRDLREALLGAGGVSDVDVVAIVREEGVEQQPEVVVPIVQDRAGDYAAAARILDRRQVDAVLIQHEYGIFGGPEGSHVIALARELRQPMVLTLHTVLEAESLSPERAETTRALCDLATLVCVFTETAKRMVVEAGLVTADRVRVVPHGGPTQLRPPEGPWHRRLLHLPRRNGKSPHAIEPSQRVLSTFGLISPGKGIETAIQAMPAIAEQHPSALYLIAGQTHPEVVKNHGEEYRLSLERLVRDLGLEEHVIFDDRFLNIEDLASMLAATSIYLTPYKSKEQIVSGALTFAVVAGCPTVSTPYYYAQDMLAAGAGILVPFDDSAALATAVNGLLADPEQLEQTRRAAVALGGEMVWPRVGKQTTDVLQEAIDHRQPTPEKRLAPNTLPQPRISHLLTLVDDVGIIQHADGVVPARSTGYCTDDVARLAIVSLGLGAMTGDPVHERNLALSLGFLRHAWLAESLTMHNLLSFDRRWLDEPHTGDHLGRAAWALGEVVSAKSAITILEPSRAMLEEMLPALAKLRSPRSMAFSILGLAHADPREVSNDAEVVLTALAQRLADQQTANAGADWYWAEDELAYDNARLPQALIAAGARLQDDELLESGLRSLDWYENELLSEDSYVRLVGHHGRRRGEDHPGLGDEQPLDAAALVEARVEAYIATGVESQYQQAMRAFEWFLGRNRLETAVYDFTTGGCHDGLGETTANVNEGAESTLAYLQALLAIDAAGRRLPISQ